MAAGPCKLLYAVARSVWVWVLYEERQRLKINHNVFHGPNLSFQGQKYIIFTGGIVFNRHFFILYTEKRMGENVKFFVSNWAINFHGPTLFLSGLILL